MMQRQLSAGATDDEESRPAPDSTSKFRWPIPFMRLLDALCNGRLLDYPLPVDSFQAAAPALLALLELLGCVV